MIKSSDADFFVDPDDLQCYCEERQFEPGQSILSYGQHYQYFYLVMEGEADLCCDQTNAALAVITLKRGATIGEVCFLTGRASRLYANARTVVRALRVDDRAWARYENDAPAAAAGLRRMIAGIAAQRESLDAHGAAGAADRACESEIEILLCRNPELLLMAQRLRYEVQCEELGRPSAHAEPKERVIADELDKFGFVFVALDKGKPIGTLRVNRASDGPLGVLEEIYGMTASRHHPGRTAVCTKFIVAKSRPDARAAFKLMSAAFAWGIREAVRECFIDSTLELLPFFRAIGFRESGPAFQRGADGKSYPLVLDLERDGAEVVRLLSTRFGIFG